MLPVRVFGPDAGLVVVELEHAIAITRTNDRATSDFRYPTATDLRRPRSPRRSQGSPAASTRTSPLWPPHPRSRNDPAASPGGRSPPFLLGPPAGGDPTRRPSRGWSRGRRR